VVKEKVGRSKIDKSEQEVVKKKAVEMNKGGIDSGRGVTPEPGLSEFMRVYFEDQKRRDEEAKRERQSRDRAIAAREKADRDREDRLLRVLTERPPARNPIQRTTIELPKMNETEDVEQFIPLFEMALRVNRVPENLWRAKLMSHIPLAMLLKVQAVMEDEDGTYQDAV